MNLADEIDHATTDGMPVLLHSDLHSQHVLVENGSLKGVLDFGGAFVGPREWDFAVIGMFNGWMAADAAIGSYPGGGPEIERRARLVALAFGLYRLTVAHEDGDRIVAGLLLKRLTEALDFLADAR